MPIDEFLEPPIVIVSGKGGVGKTTVAASLALVAARHGRKVCIAEVDRKGSVPKLFGRGPVGYDPTPLSPGVWAMNVLPELALEEYLRVQYRMRGISKVFTSTQFIDYVTTAAPGLKDILVLGKIWYLEQGRAGRRDGPRFDTIVVDAPAAGHMLTFLSAPSGLSDAVRVGPIKRQADWLIGMLRDASRTRVHLVTLAEEMPVSETLEASAALTSRLGIPQGAVFANAVYPELFEDQEQTRLEEMSGDGRRLLAKEGEAAGLDLDDDDIEAAVGYARFLLARRRIQDRHLRTLRRSLDQPVVELPFSFSAGLALPDIEKLADVMEERAAAL